MTFKIMECEKSAGFYMNGNDFYSLLPDEIKEHVDKSDNPSVNKFFSQDYLIVLSTSRPVYFGNITEEIESSNMGEFNLDFNAEVKEVLESETSLSMYTLSDKCLLVGTE